MAQIDFPNSPTVGQTYTAPSGATYTWDGVKWSGSPVTSQRVPGVGGNSGRYLYTDGSTMTWADPPQGGALENVYPPDGASTDSFDYFFFTANSPIASKASQWQFTNNDPSFTTIAYDTGIVTFEPSTRIYNTIFSAPYYVNNGVAYPDYYTNMPSIPSDTLIPGTVYWRARFQNRTDDVWTDWTSPTNIIYASDMPAYAMGTPGPGTGQYDMTTDTGYYGFVTAQDFINGDDLASELGFTSGAAQNSDTGWLKFYSGPNSTCNTTASTQVLYIPKMSFRHSVQWNQINAANLVFGTRTVSVGGATYRVRLMTGGEASPGTGSEWNELIYRVHAAQPESKSNWETFDTIETNITSGNGRSTWCQETSGGRRVMRGNVGLASWNTGLHNYTYANGAWRPVLEWIG